MSTANADNGNRIPLAHRGRRPRFFAAPGVDELVSAVLELTSEVWVLRQRMWLLEKAAADSGLDLTAKLEAYQPTAEEAAELTRMREALVAGVLRGMEGDYVERSRVQKEIDAAGATGVPPEQSEQQPDVVPARDRAA